MPKTAQDATVARIQDTGLFDTVARYGGEADDASKMTVTMPAALVVAKDSDYAGRTRHDQDVLIAYRNPGQQAQEGGGLSLAEQLARRLTDTDQMGHTWADDTSTYQLDVEEGLRARALKITATYAIYVLSFRVEQWAS